MVVNQCVHSLFTPWTGEELQLESSLKNAFLADINITLI